MKSSVVKSFIYVTLLVFTISCQKQERTSNEPDKTDDKYVFVSPLGKKFQTAEPSEKMLKLYQEAKANFESEPENIDNIIWFGRRTAYLGKYEEAIQVYSDGIKKFPDESRLYRHRGHRYISIREFDKAIEDLSKAAELIEGTENSIEPDGLPNALGIPVSSRHGNIWYHLGLAYYLKHDYENSYVAYLKCRESGNNDDNIVSSTHWLYMNQRRLGNEQLAEQMLEPINQDAEIIENHSYYKLCLFYKGLLPMDSLISKGENTSSSDAIKYGLASWYLYNDQKEQARRELENILNGDVWASFGYIAAESDMIAYFK